MLSECGKQIVCQQVLSAIEWAGAQTTLEFQDEFLFGQCCAALDDCDGTYGSGSSRIARNGLNENIVERCGSDYHVRERSRGSANRECSAALVRSISKFIPKLMT